MATSVEFKYMGTFTKNVERKGEIKTFMFKASKSNGENNNAENAPIGYAEVYMNEGNLIFMRFRPAGEADISQKNYNPATRKLALKAMGMALAHSRRPDAEVY